MANQKWARDLAEADETGGGNYIKIHGKYLLALKEVIDKTEKQDDKGQTVKKSGFKGDSYVLNFLIIDAAKRLQSDPLDPHPVGDIVSTVFKPEDKEMRGRMRQVLRALVNKADREFDEKAAVQALALIEDPTQPLAGKLVMVDTYEYTNQGRKDPSKRGEKGVGTTYSSVPQQTYAPTAGQAFLSVQEVRAAILAGHPLNAFTIRGQAAPPAPAAPTETAPTAA